MTGALPPVPAWRADRLAARLPVLRQRAAVQAAIRAFFAARGFIEVETPCLQVSPGLDAHVRGVRADLRGPDGTPHPRWLHTSPEFAMKKLLAGGMERIFQIAPVFRDGDLTRLHQPEFRLLEYYQTGLDLQGLIALTSELVQACAEATEAPACLTALPATVHLGHALIERTGLRAGDLAEGQALREACQSAGLHVGQDDGVDDLLHRLIGQLIEPSLPRDRPVWLTGWPMALAALARPDPADPGFAERAELMVAGVELANGWVELTDPDLLRGRLEAGQRLLKARYGMDVPLDEDLLRAHDHAAGFGLPACAGMALGLDRLVMLVTGAERLADVLWLPVLDDPR